MTIRDLYLMCSNIDYNKTVFRVGNIGSEGWNYIGSYSDMPEKIRNNTIVTFDFDKDMSGVIVITE